MILRNSVQQISKRKGVRNMEHMKYKKLSCQLNLWLFKTRAQNEVERYVIWNVYCYLHFSTLSPEYEERGILVYVYVDLVSICKLISTHSLLRPKKIVKRQETELDLTCWAFQVSLFRGKYNFFCPSFSLSFFFVKIILPISILDWICIPALLYMYIQHIQPFLVFHILRRTRNRHNRSIVAFELSLRSQVQIVFWKRCQNLASFSFSAMQYYT